MNAKESSSANKSAHIIEINLRGKIASIQKDAVYDHFSTLVDDGIVHVDGYDRKFRIHLRSFDHLKSLENCIRASFDFSSNLYEVSSDVGVLSGFP